MAEVCGVRIYRDGGTIEFRLSDTPVEGLYRLASPLRGQPQLLFRDSEPLPVGGTVEAAVLAQLCGWLSGVAVGSATAALADLTQLREWSNLPDRLERVVPLCYIGRVVERLGERAGSSAV